MSSEPPRGAVPYRQVHDELEDHGFVPVNSFTKPRRLLIRIYERADGEMVRFPTSGKLVAYAIYQKIHQYLVQLEDPEDTG